MEQKQQKQMQWLGEVFSSLEGLTIPRLVRWSAAGIILALIGGVGFLVYYTGGAKYVYSHLMYLPVLLAAIFFGGRGGLIAGILGGVVLGPWMPVNVTTGESQMTLNWLLRTGSFVMIGTLFGSTASHLRRQLQRLRWSASHDAVTGLPNKVYLYQKLKESGTPATSSSTVLAHINIDNYFEIINTLGVDAGENLARQIFARISDTLHENEYVCHTHSDRFSVLLLSSTNRHTGETLSRILKGLRKSCLVDGVPLYIDTSVGFAMDTEGQDASMQLVRKANIALHKAQKTGQELVKYDPAFATLSRERLALIGEIPEAIEKNQFSLHYQPKIDLRNGRILGVEALLRWHHPQRGYIPPGEFIFQIEDTGLIHNITRWVATRALEQLSLWHSQGLHLTMAFNISTRNFLEADLVPFLRMQLDHFGITPDLLELEITETAVMADVQNSIALLGELKKLGVSISIDDFGTGYSSLAYLKQLPVDSIKIDQAFTRNLAKDSADVSIVQAVIAMARGLGKSTVAEGVEDQETLAILERMGCDIAQGYYFCRPKPAEEITSLLNSLLPVTGPPVGAILHH